MRSHDKARLHVLMRALVVLSMSACGAPALNAHAGAAPASAPVSVPKPQPTARADALIVSCEQVGPLHCNAEASSLDPELLCQQLRECTIGRAGPGAAAIASVQSCALPEKALELPEEQAFQTASIVTMEGEDSTGRSIEGAYLVVSRDGRHCVVDEVLVPDAAMGWWRDDFTLAWDASSSCLAVQAQRVGHISLDQEELANGESDYDGELWTRACYRFGERVVTAEGKQERFLLQENEDSPWRPFSGSLPQPPR